MNDNDFLSMIDVWPFSSDGAATAPPVDPGDFEIQAVNGACWWSTLEVLSSTNYNIRGWRVPEDCVQGIRLKTGQRIYIWNPAGVDTILRRVR